MAPKFMPPPDVSVLREHYALAVELDMLDPGATEVYFYGSPLSVGCGCERCQLVNILRMGWNLSPDEHRRLTVAVLGALGILGAPSAASPN